MEDGFRSLIMTAFREGEGVCIAPTREHEDGSRTPERGVTLTREQWLDKLQKKGSIQRIYSTKEGLFLRVNPMKKGGQGRNEDVTAFRHVLVEFDRDSQGQDIPKELQLGSIIHSGLPITAILDSGNKSVHAWVKVDAANVEEYNARVDVVYSLFDSAALDKANRNPSRLSRCPEGRRMVNGEVKEQRLLALNLGAKSWADFERLRTTAELGEPMTLEELLAYDVPNDPNNMIGSRWLCLGSSLVIVSQSGVGKSSLNMQLAIGWGLAREEMTFGIKPIRPLKSLIVQAENDTGDLAEAAQGVVNAHQLTPEERKQANQNLLWHRITTYTGAEFCRKLEDLVTLHKPDIAWIDPLINFIGDDLSEASVIANFCTNWLNSISRKTGVIFALIHHTGKPPKEGSARGTNSDLAYAGLGSSALVNWAREVMVLSRVKAPEGDPATFTLTACKRRKRAGMKDMSGEVSEEIHIRHAGDGTIRWEQCEAPEVPDKRSKKKQDSPAAAGYSLRRRGEGTEAIPGVLERAEDTGEGGDTGAPATSAPEAPAARSYTLRRGVGQPAKLDSNARAAIAAALAANGGILTPAEREQFAATFGVSTKTIRRFEDAANGAE
jgi:RecA-family ATPase